MVRGGKDGPVPAEVFDLADNTWSGTKRWKDDATFARQTHLWFQEPSFRKSRALLGLGREEFSRAIRWLTGFAFLQSPNAKVNTEEDDQCRLCAQAPEKADHILRVCPALNQLRWECFGMYQLTGEVGWEVSAVVRFLGDQRVCSLEDSEDSGGSQGVYDSDDEEIR